MRFETVLFDLDGTLVDSFELITQSFRHAVRTARHREATDDEVFSRWGEPLRIRLESIAAPEQLPDVVAAYTAFYQEHHDRLARLFPGIAEMIGQLAHLGCRLGVVTSKRRTTTTHDLAVFGLAPFIRATVTADDVTVFKPAADPVREALHRLGGDAQDALMVGDAVFDILSGTAAGVATAAALWGARDPDAVLAAAPDYVVERPEDVPPLAAG
ncbi:MAG: HAD family hydrolase [bacterium]